MHGILLLLVAEQLRVPLAAFQELLLRTVFSNAPALQDYHPKFLELWELT